MRANPAIRALRASARPVRRFGRAWLPNTPCAFLARARCYIRHADARSSRGLGLLCAATETRDPVCPEGRDDEVEIECRDRARRGVLRSQALYRADECGPCERYAVRG